MCATFADVRACTLKVYIVHVNGLGYERNGVTLHPHGMSSEIKKNRVSLQCHVHTYKADIVLQEG